MITHVDLPHVERGARKDWPSCLLSGRTPIWVMMMMLIMNMMRMMIRARGSLGRDLLILGDDDLMLIMIIVLIIMIMLAMVAS